MKRALIISLLVVPLFTKARHPIPDSLHLALKNASNDSVRYLILTSFETYYEERMRDSALYFARQQLQLARHNNKKLPEALALQSMGYNLMHLGQFSESLKCFLDAFEIVKDARNENSLWSVPPGSTPHRNRLVMLARIHHSFGHLLGRVNNTEQRLYHYWEAKRIAQDINDKQLLYLVNMNLGATYRSLNIDSALYFELSAERISKESGNRNFLSVVLMYKGDIYFRKGERQSAIQAYQEGVRSAREQNLMSGLTRLYFSLSRFYIAEKQKDSSLYYSRKAKQGLVALGGISGTEWNMGTANENLFNTFKLYNKQDSVLKYLLLAKNANDSINKSYIKSISEYQNLSFAEQTRLQQLEKENVIYQNRIWINTMLGSLFTIVLVTLILYRNNRQKHKANQVLEQTLSDLKSTQTQLVHSEKMASLGELTAGIAHEIQNPLNFVNNFSEVNSELIAEMKTEIEKGNLNDAKTIAASIDENEQKIIFHGKRADAIVKGMLQHSRSSSGVKEPTDINALADEYLRLAYHGLRAKDKSFNATMKTDFDTTVGKINVVPQDIGRVILNLITNAFFAVSDKSSFANLSDEASAKLEATEDKKYEPTVTVSTRKLEGKVEISVKDNGNGIPAKVLDKIFQPFFTTKPTGQGTGLGLSLSYDIVKAHGGELKVETKDNEGAQFIIILPI